MTPDRVEEVEEAHVEAQREGSAAALLGGLLILALLAGSRYFCYLFLACVRDRRPKLMLLRLPSRSDTRLEWAVKDERQGNN